jgi:hypothetical protein
MPLIYTCLCSTEPSILLAYIPPPLSATRDRENSLLFWCVLFKVLFVLCIFTIPKLNWSCCISRENLKLNISDAIVQLNAIAIVSSSIILHLCWRTIVIWSFHVSIPMLKNLPSNLWFMLFVIQCESNLFPFFREKSRYHASAIVVLYP